MKKRLSKMMLLGMGAVLLLTGCKKKEEAPVVEETPEIIVEEVVPEEPEETEHVIPLSIHTKVNDKTYYFEDGETAYLYLQYCDVTVEGDGYEKVKRNIENWSLERSEGLRSLYTSFEEQAVSSNAQAQKDFYGYSLYQTVQTARVDDAVVSLLDDTYQYIGGDHGEFHREGINFDAQTGKRLALSELFTDYEHFVEDAKERIIYELKDRYEDDLFADYESSVRALWQDGAEPQWYLDASGIIIVLQEYSVGDYKIGAPEICFPYSEYKAYLKESYLPGEGDGVAVFQANQEVTFPLPGTGQNASLMFLWEEGEDGISYSSLWLDQSELKLEDYLSLEDIYLIKYQGEVYCMLVVDYASDDYETSTYRLTNGILEKIDTFETSIDGGNINAHEIKMETRIDFLGSYGGMKTYRFDGNGRLATDDTEYVLERNRYVLTSKTDLPVLLDGEETESTLPAGSNIIINATDGETYVKFTLQETGQTGTMMVQRDPKEWSNITINGINENDCFEMLPYAG